MDGIAFSQPFAVLSAEQLEQMRTKCALLSLSPLFASLPDPRSRHGLRDDVPFLLTCLVAALLCNGNHSEAVAQWCRGQRTRVEQVFGQRRSLSPPGALSLWVLPRLSINALQTLLSCWVCATLHPDSASPIALVNIRAGCGAFCLTG